jgi:hypothetical protein
MDKAPLVEIRVRTRVSAEELEQKVGKIITDKDLNVVLTGPTLVRKPDGSVLCIYLPGVLNKKLVDGAYPALHSIQGKTDNRGLASGSQRVQRVGGIDPTSRAATVKSSLIGYFERQGGRFPFCRTTAWTGEHAAEFKEIFPLFDHIAEAFSTYLPDRYAAQAKQASLTDRGWLIGDTPFTTVTVNNTYPTGVHKDAGDLDQGFSNLVVLRRGEYSGGILTFPEYRVGANMGDGDLILMDSHEWHGNTKMVLGGADAERISLVLYFRTNMVACGTPEEEADHAKRTRSPDFQFDAPEPSDTVTTVFDGQHDPAGGVERSY